MTPDVITDAWTDAVPENVYDPCPCGCGKAFRFVLKGGEKELAKHEANFAAKEQK